MQAKCTYEHKLGSQSESYILANLTDADFKFNRSVDIKHHGSFVEAGKQLVLAATEIWLMGERLSSFGLNNLEN